MPGAVNTNVTSSDITSTIAQINQVRQKYGYAAMAIADSTVGSIAKSTHIDTMKAQLQQIVSAIGYSTGTTNLNTITAAQYAAGTAKFIPSVMQTLSNVAVAAYSYCSCNCDRCSCDCDYCCDNCGCDYCSCDCNDCCDYGTGCTG